jgi:hypothetical protein
MLLFCLKDIRYRTTTGGLKSGTITRREEARKGKYPGFRNRKANRSGKSAVWISLDIISWLRYWREWAGSQVFLFCSSEALRLQRIRKSGFKLPDAL